MEPETSSVSSVTRRHPIRILAATAVLLLFAVMLSVLSIFQARLPTSTLRQNGFLGADPNAVYACAGNGLASADGTRISLYTPSGNCAAQETVYMSSPVCAGSSLLAVFYDAEASGIHTLYPDGTHRYTDTEGGVVFADANETGLITVIWENGGNRRTVMVYDTDLTPLFRWDPGVSVPLAGRTSGEDLLCVSSLTREGSLLHYFHIDIPEEQYRIPFPGEILEDFDFLSDGSLAAVSDERLILSDTKGNLLSSTQFGDYRPEVWCLSGSQAVVCSVSGSDSTIISVGTDGSILGSAPAPFHVKALSVQDEILVLFDRGESTLYDRDLSEIVNYQPDPAAEHVFLTPKGMAFFTGPAGVTLADFGR